MASFAIRQSGVTGISRYHTGASQCCASLVDARARVAEFMPPQLRWKDWGAGRLAKAARDTFERFVLTSYELTECSLDQPQAAGLTARVTVEDSPDVNDVFAMT